jgi:hypothetical protein
MQRFVWSLLLFFCAARAEAYDRLWRDDQCSLQQPGRPPVHMSCIVQSSMSQGVRLLIVTTPDERRYEIRNTEADLDRWFIDERPATERLQGRFGVCYSTSELKICLSHY